MNNKSVDLDISNVEKKPTLQGHQSLLLALLFVLTVCTNYRLPETPLGAGEIGLVMAGLAAILHQRPQLLSSLRQYWMLVALCGGYLLILALAGVLSAGAGRLSVGWSHDVAALLFAMAAAFIVLLQAGSSRPTMETFGRGFVWLALGVSCFAFLLLTGDYLAREPAFSSVFNANGWWPYRFSAWARDPNQWALLLLVAGMLMVLLPGRLQPIPLAVLFWLLLETRSDAAVAGMLAFVVVYAVLVYWRQRGLWRRALVVLAIFLVLCGAFRPLGERFPPSPVLRAVGAVADVPPSRVMLKKAFGVKATDSRLFIGEGRNKLAVRMTLWKNSLVAWRHSPFVGFGPGAYSGLEKPFEDWESHNLFLQILVNTGLVGLLAALAFASWLVVSLWRTPLAALWIAGFIGLLVQGLGQYLMRHPVFWLFIVVLVWQAVHSRVPAADSLRPARPCAG